MAFDAATFAPQSVSAAPVRPTLNAVIVAAGEPCPVWAAQNPDRALAFLFVAPQDCAAVDILLAA